ncbi:MAG: hypothetical protein HAW67_00240 [Endozoicomonadaceae bacterium]|nr:hypothetical protein [Endozoicomonadaceae bacterium]
MNASPQENTIQYHHKENYDGENSLNQYKILNALQAKLDSPHDTNEKTPIFLMIYNNNTVSILDQSIVEAVLHASPFKAKTERENSRKKSFIPCFKNKKKYKLNTQEIHSAYCNMSGTHLVTKEGEYHTNLTLKKIAELSNLIYCNRSHLVKHAHIKKIEQLENGCGKAYIYNEDSIPISRNRMKGM